MQTYVTRLTDTVIGGDSPVPTPAKDFISRGKDRLVGYVSTFPTDIITQRIITGGKCLQYSTTSNIPADHTTYHARGFIGKGFEKKKSLLEIL